MMWKIIMPQGTCLTIKNQEPWSETVQSVCFRTEIDQDPGAKLNKKSEMYEDQSRSLEY